MKRRSAVAPELPALLFASADRATRAWLYRLKRSGRVRAVGPRLYTSVPAAQVPTALRREWYLLVSNLFPRAMISHRTALEYRPSGNGSIFLTASTRRVLRYPGLTLHFLTGPAPLPADVTFVGIRASSLARAFLENLLPSRARSEDCKALPIADLERRLELILTQHGESGLNELRDRARSIATQFGWDRAYKRLDRIIGALLGSKTTSSLQTNSAKARAIGRPYDATCLERLNVLFAELIHYPFHEQEERFDVAEHYRNKAFFEAYFSNYIEGTRFAVDEAERIIFEQFRPPDRPFDTHDILGTFAIVSDPNEMKRVPSSLQEFTGLLQTRHRSLLANRREITAGEFKVKPNRAGNTHFVTPQHVIGTLEHGFELYKSLSPGLARAIFVMFLITDVHPFQDGNGRVARIFLNAELYSQHRTTIIVPTVAREDYLLALRALSRRQSPDAIIRLSTRLQAASNIAFRPYRSALTHMKKHNWFEEPDDAVLIFP